MLHENIICELLYTSPCISCSPLTWGSGIWALSTTCLRSAKLNSWFSTPRIDATVTPSSAKVVGSVSASCAPVAPAQVSISKSSPMRSTDRIVVNWAVAATRLASQDGNLSSDWLIFSIGFRGKPFLNWSKGRFFNSAILDEVSGYGDVKLRTRTVLIK